MPAYLRHLALASTRNSTTTHASHPSTTSVGTTSTTTSPATGTVVSGAVHTPAAGNLIVMVGAGAVTATTPSGWTLATGASAVGTSGLYAFWKVAGGSVATDTFATTHNGSNYPFMFHWFTFPTGSTFGTAASATNVASATTGVTLSGLTGINWVAYLVSQSNGSTSVVKSVTWSGATELVDTSVVNSTTDGYLYSLALNEYSTAASTSATATVANTDTARNNERMVFSVKVPQVRGQVNNVNTLAARYRPPIW